MRTLLLCLAVVIGVPAMAQQQAPPCDRACLQKWVDDYLVALRDQNADPALFSPRVRFTENGVELPFGSEGLWHAMSGIGSDRRSACGIVLLYFINCVS